MKIDIKIDLNLPYSTIDRYKEKNYSNGFDSSNHIMSKETPKVLLANLFLAVEIKCKFKDGDTLQDMISECKNISSGKNKKLFEILNIGNDLQNFMRTHDSCDDSYSNGKLSEEFYNDFEPLSKNTIGKRYVLHSMVTEDVVNVEKELLNYLSNCSKSVYDKTLIVSATAGAWRYQINRNIDYTLQEFIDYRTLQLKKDIYNIK